MAEIMFEQFKVPGFCIGNSAVTSLFASGRTRGVVLESGAGVSHAVPIFEGYALPHATLQLQIAGIDLTTHLRSLLHEKRGLVLEHETVCDIKEKLCYAASTSSEQELRSMPEATEDYELPDGQVISIDRECQNSSAELLFRPELVSENALDGGLPEMTLRAISMCDTDVQQDLLNSVVVAGGSSMLPGFLERLDRELASRQKEGPRPQVVPDPQGTEPGYNSQRKHAAWIGASMFASLSTFRKVEVTKQEWEDNAERVVHRKCF
jgi:actin-related protein